MWLDPFGRQQLQGKERAAEKLEAERNSQGLYAEPGVEQAVTARCCSWEWVCVRLVGEQQQLDWEPVQRGPKTDTS